MSEIRSPFYKIQSIRCGVYARTISVTLFRESAVSLHSTSTSCSPENKKRERRRDEVATHLATTTTASRARHDTRSSTGERWIEIEQERAPWSQSRAPLQQPCRLPRLAPALSARTVDEL